MSNCRYKKIIQFYLDGSHNGHDSKDLEQHLKTCVECQIQLAELEELNSAAFQIIDEAPDRSYWESFSSRVRNRIASRDIEPVSSTRRTKPSWFASLRMASVLVTLLLLAGYSFLIIQRGINIIGERRTADFRSEISNVQEPLPTRVLPPSDQLPGSANNAPEIDQADRQLANTPSNEKPEPVDQSRLARNNDLIIETRDITGDLRGIKIMNVGAPKLETEIRSQSPVFASYIANIDPSFHMKDSYVSQRLIALLNEKPRVGLGSLYLTFNNGLSIVGPGGERVSPTNETQSSWGYTSISSDTSRSGEIRQYYLELELMQAK